ncbi:MAG: class A beta-lactamase-related serine hydrolase [Proteobacteria bacterium]|nr:MAG: class A beta-lactamase-related serine hydrolase [Pseudomonadota bacterium]
MLKRLASMLILSSVTVFANDGVDSSSKIYSFEHGLRNPLLIKGKKNQYHSISEEMMRYKIPGLSLALIINGELRYVLNYGNSVESQPITNGTLFQAGSIAKVFNTIGALKLYQDGKVTLNNNVNDYLKSWNLEDNQFTQRNKVTIEELMSHTGGINVPGFSGIDRRITPLPTSIDALNGTKPYIVTPKVQVVAEPGTRFSYSGGGMLILQQIIEDQTGANYTEWMKNNVLGPIGMKNSTFSQPLLNKYTEYAACGHDSNGNELTGCWHNYPEQGAAGLWTTSTDLSQALIALIHAYYKESNALPINIDIARKMFIEHKNYGIGLGVFVQSLDNIIEISHNGSVDGYKSSMTAFVNKDITSNSVKLKDGIIILTNGENGWNLYPEIIASFTETFGIHAEKPIIITEVKPKKINLYTGKYILTNDITSWSFKIIKKNAKLFCDYGQGVPQELHFADKNLAYTLDGTKFTFVFDNKNKIDRLEILLYEDSNISHYKHL